LKNELKHKIKEDEFAVGVEKASGWAFTHRDELKIGLLVVVLLGVGAYGLQYFREQRDSEANRDFAEALATFGAPVKSELAEGAPAPAGQVFATSKEKYQKALTDFEGVERRHASHLVATRSEYYAALCRLELGDTDAAEKALTTLASRREGDALDAALSKLALGELYRRTGKADKAVATFQQLVDDPQAAVPRDYALMRLASTQDEGNHPTEARASYQKLANEFPASIFAGEARRRADYLQTAG
jgi:hypothetical protein